MQNLEMQVCLTKAVTAFKLRDILTRFGVPEDEPVTVYIKRSEQDLASCEIQPTSRKNYLETSEISSRDFRPAIINDFLNPALKELEMCQYFPVAGELEECKIKIIFTSGKSGFNTAIESVCCVRCPDGSNCCGFC